MCIFKILVPFLIQLFLTEAAAQPDDNPFLCDNVGCGHVPKLFTPVNSDTTLHLRMLSLGWSANYMREPEDSNAPCFHTDRSLSTAFAPDKNVFDTVYAPDYAKVAVGPSVRVDYNDFEEYEEERLISDKKIPAEKSNSGLKVNPKLFLIDHLVFAMYGSFALKMLYFSNIWKNLNTSEEPPACVQLLHFIFSSGAGAYKNNENLNQLQNNFRSVCGTELFQKDKEKELYEENADYPAEFLEGENNQILDISFGDGTVDHFYEKYPRVAFKDCIDGEKNFVDDSDGVTSWEITTLGATVYHDKYYEKNLAPSTVGKIEVALSVEIANEDTCILVDAQRLFTTNPVGYLTPWECAVGHGEDKVRVPATVVSYSSAVTLVSCDLTNLGNDEEDRAERIRLKKIKTPSAFSSGRPHEARSQGSQTADTWLTLIAPTRGWSVSVSLCQMESFMNPVEGDIPRNEKYREERENFAALKTSDYVPMRFANYIDGTVKNVREEMIGKRTVSNIRKNHYKRKITVCSQVLYGLNFPEAERIVREWILYHQLVGVDHFVIYDRDGSLKQVLSPYIRSGYVTYYPRWAKTFLSKRHETRC